MNNINNISNVSNRFFIITDKQINKLKSLISFISKGYVSEEGLDINGEAMEDINKLLESVEVQELKPK